MERYTRSQQYLVRAEEIIPGGAQTFSKTTMVYPYGVSPYFLTRGQGSRVWDVNGNEYIDFNCGLASINLGYNDADVTHAVHEQLRSGVTFSLSHPVEIEVAERLVALVPCAEMVRFGKNGSDVTAAAIRLARAYTSRDHVAVCGYHGWHDWYIAATSFHLGIPQATLDLTHTFPFNDLEALRQLFAKYPKQIAAVILEPVQKTEPHSGYLARVKEIAHANGAILIFDELITGFRLALGGAQEYFSVKPDLATFGKALANGYPLSALVGRRDIMALLKKVFFSLTYGGEAISLAAAVATLRKITTEPVIEHLTLCGLRVRNAVQELIDRHNMADIVSISGHPTGTWIRFRDVEGYTEWQVQTLFLQEVLARGILTMGKHNITYAHSNSDIDRLLDVYAEVLPFLKSTIGGRALEKSLRGPALQPAFKLR